MNDEKPEIDPVTLHYMKDVDRTLIRENLKLSHEERFRKFVAIHAFMVKARGAARRESRYQDD